MDNYSRLTVCVKVAGTQWPLANTVRECHVEVRRADETEWRTLEDVSGIDGKITIFFGEPGSTICA